MKHILPIFLFAISGIAFSQLSETVKSGHENVLPVRGFCIAAPQSKDLDGFIKFIDEELAPRSVNTLVNGSIQTTSWSLSTSANYTYLWFK